MQPAQHAANNFRILSRGLHKIKAFSNKSAVKPNFFGKFLSNAWPKIEISTNFRQKRLFKAILGFFHEKGFFRLLFNIKSHDLCRKTGQKGSVSNQKKKSMNPKFTSLLIKYSSVTSAGNYELLWKIFT